ncbi:restriction endonuclease subunit S [Mariniflexile sp. AS56]|uniref:restriction endonuclease subunit S n=1 Tax=Mariniflexile sp. AS56 TaxID=3063957 RepID=UPI0026F0FEED|nr:restriction endonuclease subunit S [Mariniflexile sp. AS56]MDO7173708.1 restriction endonuclease subunit S [Mariniflexile sp. AS56]
MTQKIDLNNLDKSDWEAFKFEEIAEKISETVNPNTTDLEIYVGLEHIDADDIHIRRFGTPNDVKGGKLRCYPGDVIFGKRRAYQRKAAIVNFEGICSAHAFVFRANPEIIDPNLFPFFLHSDQFMHRMVDISVGGLSPTINWGDLRQQEFLLPPKDQQAKLAELLWAMDEVIERENEVLIRLNVNYASEKKDIYESQENKKIVLGEKINILSGFAFKSKLFNTSNEGMPLIRIRDIAESKIETYYSGEFDEKYLIKRGDLIVGMDGDFIMNIWDNEDALLNQRVLKIRLNENENSLLFSYLNHFLQKELDKIHLGIGATTVKHLAVSDVRKIKLPIPKNNVKTVIEKLDLFNTNIKNIEYKISSSKALQKSLINQVF